MTTHRLCALALGLMLWGAPAVAPAAPAPEDPYLAGYAGAVLEREFKLDRRAVTVQNGVLTLDGAQLKGADRAAVVTTLSNLPGVVRVEVREATGRAPAVAPGAAPAAVSSLPTGLLPAGPCVTVVSGGKVSRGGVVPSQRIVKHWSSSLLPTARLPPASTFMPIDVAVLE